MEPTAWPSWRISPALSAGLELPRNNLPILYGARIFSAAEAVAELFIFRRSVMSVHRIRLHGPWQVRPHDVHLSPGRMTIPGSLREGGFADFKGRVSMHRQFGKPTNLDAHDQVWLAFDEIRGLESISLNGLELHAHGERLEFEVTGLLQKRNEIEVVLICEEDRCGVVGKVLLEIRRT